MFSTLLYHVSDFQTTVLSGETTHKSRSCNGSSVNVFEGVCGVEELIELFLWKARDTLTVSPVDGTLKLYESSIFLVYLLIPIFHVFLSLPNQFCIVKQINKNNIVKSALFFTTYLYRKIFSVTPLKNISAYPNSAAPIIQKISTGSMKW